MNRFIHEKDLFTKQLCVNKNEGKKAGQCDNMQFEL